MRGAWRACMFGCICVIVLSTPGARAAEQPATETARIEALIRTVEKLKGAVFVRNDREYDGKEAGEHPRRKWRWKRKDIKTARDFIRIAATRSSVSGKPYLIRYKDGREVRSADFLLAELKKLEAPREKGGG